MLPEEHLPDECILVGIIHDTKLWHWKHKGRDTVLTSAVELNSAWNENLNNVKEMTS